MFLGLFIFLLGIFALFEALGFIKSNVKWGIPLAIIVFGISLMYPHIQKFL